FFFFSSRRRHTRFSRDWSSDVCSSDLFPDAAIVDLAEQSIAAYDYAHRYPAGDAFLALAEAMIRHRDIVMATPVYWYAMSAQLRSEERRVGKEGGCGGWARQYTKRQTE